MATKNQIEQVIFCPAAIQICNSTTLKNMAMPFNKYSLKKTEIDD